MESPSRLFDEIQQWSADRGLSLVGAVDAERFDETQPPGRRARELLSDCDTVVLFGSGGREAWRAMTARRRIERARPRYHPIDDWSRAIAADVLARLARAGHAGRIVQPDDRRGLNLRQLAEIVGFGTISPVTGHLLHPEYGPWVSLRAVLLLVGRPFGPRPPAPRSDFQPCLGCDKPCVSDCPATAYDGDGSFVFDRCATERFGGGCESGCASLRACPVGAEHRYGPDEERFRHAYGLFAMRRLRGNGVWRLVSGLLRPGS